MDSVFTSKGVRWTHKRIAADPSVRNGQAPLALKFAPELSGDGRVQPKLLGDSLDPGDLTPMKMRPNFLNEAAVQNYIWSSGRALSWLAGGEEAIVYWEPSYPKGDKRSDFIIETADTVRLVELEKDGRNLARKDLDAQLASAIASERIDSKGFTKKIQLVGLDVKATQPHDPSVGPERKSVSLVWGLSGRAADPNALWIVLYPQGKQPAQLTANAELTQTHCKFSDEATPYRVLIYKGQVIVPTGDGGHAYRMATIVHVVLYGKTAIARHAGGLVTKGRSDKTADWVIEIARSFHDRLGASAWEAREITVIAPNEALICFLDTEPEAVETAIKATFASDASWPRPKSYVK